MELGVFIQTPVFAPHRAGDPGYEHTKIMQDLEVAIAADRAGFPAPNVAVSIGDEVDELQARVEGVWRDAAQQHGGSMPTPAIEYLGDYISGGYGVVSDAQRSIQADVTKLTGLLVDPTYTGKALYALHEEIKKGRHGPDDHVIFWHTGGGFAPLA